MPPKNKRTIKNESHFDERKKIKSLIFNLISTSIRQAKSGVFTNKTKKIVYLIIIVNNTNRS